MNQSVFITYLSGRLPPCLACTRLNSRGLSKENELLLQKDNALKNCYIKTTVSTQSKTSKYFASEYIFITATIKVSSFVYYKKANFLAVLCLRAYIYFLFSSLLMCLWLPNQFAPTTCKRAKPQLFNLSPRKSDYQFNKKSGSNTHTKQAFHFRVDSRDQFAFDTYKE